MPMRFLVRYKQLFLWGSDWVSRLHINCRPPGDRRRGMMASGATTTMAVTLFVLICIAEVACCSGASVMLHSVQSAPAVKTAESSDSELSDLDPIPLRNCAIQVKARRDARSRLKISLLKNVWNAFVCFLRDKLVQQTLTDVQWQFVGRIGTPIKDR